MEPKAKRQGKCKCLFTLIILDFYKEDAESKTILHHTLMNANDEILEYILDNYYEYICGNFGCGNFNSFQLDGYYALHLTMSLGGFAKYK